MTSMTQEKPKLKVLITGAAGRIGSAFVRTHFQNYDLRLADRDVSRIEQHSRDILQLDITDFNACMQACAGIDTVIHLAAEVSPDISDFMTTLLPTNVVGTYNIFQAALAQGCRRVVFASSAQVIEGYLSDSASLARVDILASAGESCFRDVRSIDSMIYIGYGRFAFVVDVHLGYVRRFSLSGYFGHLYDSRDLDHLDRQISFLAASASEVLAFDRTK